MTVPQKKESMDRSAVLLKSVKTDVSPNNNFCKSVNITSDVHFSVNKSSHWVMGQPDSITVSCRTPAALAALSQPPSQH